METTQIKTLEFREVAVIGKGMMGTAAARYLAEAGKKVVLLGPDEPEQGSSALVYASHYDEARVQRLRGTDEIWTRLNLESCEEYPRLSAETGIEFHQAMGCLYVSTYPDDRYFQDQPDVAGFSGSIGSGVLSLEEIRYRFPEFGFPGPARGYFETGPAGRIHPRNLVKAQTKAFLASGGIHLPEVVTSVRKEGDGYELATYTGTRIRAEQVLVATGSFANFFDLLPKGLALERKGENVILGKVSEAEGQRLAGLPCLLYEIETDEYEGIYLLGPVRYPDGNIYLKMGCNLPEDQRFQDLTSVQNWFLQDEENDHIERLTRLFTALLPGVRFESFHTRRCIITRTPHKKPMIGNADGLGLFVATGGNGYSAMCSDALGKLAAHLVRNGEFPEGYPANEFRLVWEK